MKNIYLCWIYSGLAPCAFRYVTQCEFGKSLISSLFSFALNLVCLIFELLFTKFLSISVMPCDQHLMSKINDRSIKDICEYMTPNLHCLEGASLKKVFLSECYVGL